MNFSHNKTLAPLISVVLLSFTNIANAESYISLNIGNSDLEGVNSTSFSAAYGYKLNDNFAVEATFKDLGSYEEDLFDDGDIADFSADGLGFYLVGNKNLNDNFSLFAKLGMVAWDIEVSYMGESGSVDGTDIGYAVGASYNISENALIKLEMDRIAVDIEGESGNVDTISVGVSFAF